MSTADQTAQRELDSLVAETVKKLIAPDDNPLLAIEQLRGQVLRYAERRRQLFEQRLNAIQNCCDELHHALREHPEAERWCAELVAYERAEHQREQTSADPGEKR
jgi:hypothetical protein